MLLSICIACKSKVIIKKPQIELSSNICQSPTLTEQSIQVNDLNDVLTKIQLKNLYLQTTIDNFHNERQCLINIIHSIADVKTID